MSPIPADASPGREILRDLATGALCLLLAAFLGAAHFSQGGRLHDDYGAEPGPSLLPEILLAALALAGLGLALRGALTARRHGLMDDPSGAAQSITQQAASAITIALLVGFLVLQPAIGFGPAAAVVAAAIAVLLARQEGRAPLFAALEGTALALAIFALFRLVLAVPLP